MTLGATNWTLIGVGVSGTIGNTSKLLRESVGVTMDPMGNVYVTDADDHRVYCDVLFVINKVGNIYSEYYITFASKIISFRVLKCRSFATCLTE